MLGSLNHVRCFGRGKPGRLVVSVFLACPPIKLIEEKSDKLEKKSWGQTKV